jgi:CHAT domain-containing protein
MVAVVADPVFDENDARVSARLRARRVDAQSAAQPDPPASRERLTRSIADFASRTHRAAALVRLPFSRREAQAILAVTPAGQSFAAVDFDANRALATSREMAQYRAVHFATHGLLNNEHPQISGLVLSLVDRSGQLQDGFLDLQDSTCRTSSTSSCRSISSS